MLSAGHGPMLVYTAADEQVRNFTAHDIPFGIAPGVRYGPPDEIVLSSGDVLVLMTDGFFEWANPEGELYGTRRLEKIVRESSSLSAEEIISKMYSAVTDFARGTEQQDDLTAVVLKRL